ncbi:MAG: carboxypeptidase M32, partial [Actinobacteria bacterium]|nr:carboxypeptidase M32 [Actinomycetota bacterium]
MEERFAELKTHLAEIHDLRRAQELLFWDQSVMMPPGGGSVRTHQVTTLDRIAHEKFVSDEVGTLLDALSDYELELDDDSDDASLIRTTRRDWEKARQVPAELAAEITGAGAEAYDIWAEARANNDYPLFLPHLERAVELKRRYIDCFDGYDEP